MLYWKTFLLMCISIFVFALAGTVLIVLGVCQVVHMNAGLWFIVGGCELFCIMASIVCGFMLDGEIKERRVERDNSQGSLRS